MTCGLIPRACSGSSTPDKSDNRKLDFTCPICALPGTGIVSKGLMVPRGESSTSLNTAKHGPIFDACCLAACFPLHLCFWLAFQVRSDSCRRDWRNACRILHWLKKSGKCNQRQLRSECM